MGKVCVRKSGEGVCVRERELERCEGEREVMVCLRVMSVCV